MSLLVCRSIIPKQVLQRWENSLCESLILGSQRFYCPFKDCSSMLVDDDGGEAGLNKDERDSEDVMLMELAKRKKSAWLSAYFLHFSAGTIFNMGVDKNMKELELMLFANEMKNIGQVVKEIKGSVLIRLAWKNRKVASSMIDKDGIR
ncbi:hypothetical protein Ccrd_026217, partial [Cynara cardunculus var. scolymus]